MRWRPPRRRCGWAAALLLATLLLAPLLPATADGPVVIEAPQALAAATAGEITLIDVRSPAEWRATGLPRGAKSVTIHDPRGLDGFVAAATRAVGGKKDQPVALICATGRRSSRAADALREAGFTSVLNVREGMQGNSVDGPGWLSRNLPVEPCRRC
jgi:rhodanese-related sulfurtransferase